jgi:uncharacterized membrane protein YkgB
LEAGRAPAELKPDRPGLVTIAYLNQGSQYMGTILIILLILLLLGALPSWNHSRNWGYGPSGLLGVVVIVLLILVLLGRI